MPYIIVKLLTNLAQISIKKATNVNGDETVKEIIDRVWWGGCKTAEPMPPLLKVCGHEKEGDSGTELELDMPVSSFIELGFKILVVVHNTAKDRVGTTSTDQKAKHL